MSQNLAPRSDIHEVFQASSMVPDRLIHLIPDELAIKVPTHSLFSYPKTGRPQDGFVDVSAKAFANAVNRTSWYLESLLGKAQNFATIGYMGANDIKYILLMFGAIKCGYKMLFLSPRNNLEGHLNVLEGASCCVLLRDHRTNIDHILESRAMRTGTIPDLEQLLDDTLVPLYPYTKTFVEACNDPCLVLHTTGSTGLPKPITWKIGILSTYEAWRTIPQVNGYVPTTEIYQQARRAYTSMPLFHTSGLNSAITWSLLLGVTLVYGAPNVVPNSVYTDEMHKYAKVDASLGAPSLYEELSRDVKSLKWISKLQYVVASGAPLSDSAGDAISQYTRVISNLGSTETACLQRLAPAIEDWSYFYWHPTHSGIEMREYMDGLYELFLVRNTKLARYQGIFSTFPEIQEWSMSDLYSRHPDPSKPFLYRYRGRKDDVIVLSNGEKVSPALMEATLQSSPLVKGAMIVGRGKFQPAAIIDLGKEPPETTTGRHELLIELLPFISEANKHAPAHGQLDQYHILFADPGRPVHYLGQGKIQRYRTYLLYEKAVEDLYNATENAEEDMGIMISDLAELPSIDFDNRRSIKKWLQALVFQMCDNQELRDVDNFFEAGIDSLQVIRIARELKLQIQLANIKLRGRGARFPGIIYSNPTLSQLSEALFNATGVVRAMDSGYETEEESNVDEYDRAGNMQSLLDKYANTLPLENESRAVPATKGLVVLLTGSTGSLGSYILNELYKDDSVTHIVCLDRSSGAAEHHARTSPERGLNYLSHRHVEFLKANLSMPQLGLSDEVYNRLRSTVTHIIHNQWPVNFNWILPLFEPYIAGVRNLACLAASSLHNAFILFISSVSSVGEWKGEGHVPEAPVADLSAAANMGYGESKLISECLLDQAAKICGVRSASCRVGIVAGPIERREGLWNKHEYIPSIIVSSQALGAFPSAFPGRDCIDWLPVDKVSKILVEILHFASKDTECITQTFHVVNPRTTSWSSDVATTLIPMYPSGTMRGVEFEQWVEELRNSAEEAEKTGQFEVEQNPALRLLDFYTDISSFGARQGSRWLPSARAELASSTLGNLGPLKQDWLENWMIQWGIKSG
ncbi:putative NRPS-like enzyme [Whalleya microplaca]|nr:putative NRPS-like enzyme [Whalleya microplaca]